MENKAFVFLCGSGRRIVFNVSKQDNINAFFDIFANVLPLMNKGFCLYCIFFIYKKKKKNLNPKDGNFKIGYGLEAMVNSYKNCLPVEIQNFCNRLIITESRTDMTVIGF